jgi:hypothetical protein
LSHGATRPIGDLRRAGLAPFTPPCPNAYRTAAKASTRGRFELEGHDGTSPAGHCFTASGCRFSSSIVVALAQRLAVRVNFLALVKTPRLPAERKLPTAGVMLELSPRLAIRIVVREATGSYLALAKLAGASDFLAPANAPLTPAKTPYRCHY